MASLPDKTALKNPRTISPFALNILIAEDNAVNQRLVCKILENSGHKVTVANNGQDALNAWELHNHRSSSEHSNSNSRFDLILMDIQMPIMGGVEATSAVRSKKQEIGGHIPIVALTANAMAGHREQYLAAGMDEYISKPIDKKKLFDVINQVIAKSKIAPSSESENMAIKPMIAWQRC